MQYSEMVLTAKGLMAGLATFMALLMLNPMQQKDEHLTADAGYTLAAMSVSSSPCLCGCLDANKR